MEINKKLKWNTYLKQWYVNEDIKNNYVEINIMIEFYFKEVRAKAIIYICIVWNINEFLRSVALQKIFYINFINQSKNDWYSLISITLRH